MRISDWSSDVCSSDLINVASLCFMVPFGLAEATTERVGNAVGRGRGSHGVRQAAFAGGVLVLATQLVGGSILLLGHDQIVALYTRDAVVAALDRKSTRLNSSH